MLDKMKHLSIEEMHIQHIHSKTRTTNVAIWIILDSINPELSQRYYLFLSTLILFLRQVLPQ